MYVCQIDEYLEEYLNEYKCDWACENRACGLKYTISFDKTYLNTEI